MYNLMAFSNLKEIEVPITSFVDLVTAVSFFKKVPEHSLCQEFMKECICRQNKMIVHSCRFTP